MAIITHDIKTEEVKPRVSDAKTLVDYNPQDSRSTFRAIQDGRTEMFRDYNLTEDELIQEADNELGFDDPFAGSVKGVRVKVKDDGTTGIEKEPQKGKWVEGPNGAKKWVADEDPPPPTNVNPDFSGRFNHRYYLAPKMGTSGSSTVQQMLPATLESMVKKKERWYNRYFAYRPNKVPGFGGEKNESVIQKDKTTLISQLIPYWPPVGWVEPVMPAEDGSAPVADGANPQSPTPTPTVVPPVKYTYTNEQDLSPSLYANATQNGSYELKETDFTLACNAQLLEGGNTIPKTISFVKCSKDSPTVAEDRKQAVINVLYQEYCNTPIEIGLLSPNVTKYLTEYTISAGPPAVVKYRYIGDTVCPTGEDELNKVAKGETISYVNCNCLQNTVYEYLVETTPQDPPGTPHIPSASEIGRATLRLEGKWRYEASKGFWHKYNKIFAKNPAGNTPADLEYKGHDWSVQSGNEQYIDPTTYELIFYKPCDCLPDSVDNKPDSKGNRKEGLLRFDAFKGNWYDDNKIFASNPTEPKANWKYVGHGWVKQSAAATAAALEAEAAANNLRTWVSETGKKIEFKPCNCFDPPINWFDEGNRRFNASEGRWSLDNKVFATDPTAPFDKMVYRGHLWQQQTTALVSTSGTAGTSGTSGTAGSAPLQLTADQIAQMELPTDIKRATIDAIFKPVLEIQAKVGSGNKKEKKRVMEEYVNATLQAETKLVELYGTSDISFILYEEKKLKTKEELENDRKNLSSLPSLSGAMRSVPDGIPQTPQRTRAEMIRDAQNTARASATSGTAGTRGTAGSSGTSGTGGTSGTSATSGSISISPELQPTPVIYGDWQKFVGDYTLQSPWDIPIVMNVYDVGIFNKNIWYLFEAGNEIHMTFHDDIVNKSSIAIGKKDASWQHYPSWAGKWIKHCLEKTGHTLHADPSDIDKYNQAVIKLAGSMNVPSNEKSAKYKDGKTMVKDGIADGVFKPSKLWMTVPYDKVAKEIWTTDPNAPEMKKKITVMELKQGGADEYQEAGHACIFVADYHFSKDGSLTQFGKDLVKNILEKKKDWQVCVISRVSSHTKKESVAHAEVLMYLDLEGNIITIGGNTNLQIPNNAVEPGASIAVKRMKLADFCRKDGETWLDGAIIISHVASYKEKGSYREGGLDSKFYISDTMRDYFNRIGKPGEYLTSKLYEVISGKIITKPEPPQEAVVTPGPEGAVVRRAPAGVTNVRGFAQGGGAPSVSAGGIPAVMGSTAMVNLGPQGGPIRPSSKFFNGSSIDLASHLLQPKYAAMEQWLNRNGYMGSAKSLGIGRALKAAIAGGGARAAGSLHGCSLAMDVRFDKVKHVAKDAAIEVFGKKCSAYGPERGAGAGQQIPWSSIETNWTFAQHPHLVIVLNNWTKAQTGPTMDWGAAWGNMQKKCGRGHPKGGAYSASIPGSGHVVEWGIVELHHWEVTKADIYNLLKPFEAEVKRFCPSCDIRNMKSPSQFKPLQEGVGRAMGII
jgi:hypothetical protein